MDTMAEDKDQSSLYKLFESAALSHPHSIATIFDDGDTVALVTYSDVLKSSFMIADVLRDIGWKDQSVGLYCGATQEIPAVLLGILQASCFFVPLDPLAPLHITTHVILATALQIVLVQANQLTSFLDTIGKKFQIEICFCDKLKNADFVIIRIHQEGNKDIPSSGLGLAYVMHTSGTTGLPKVIRVAHKCIVPNILHLGDTLNITENDVIFNAATLTFDTSIVEIFLALSQGASVLMVPSAVKLMPRRLMGILMRNHVTVIQATPTLIQRFDVHLLRTHLFGTNSTLRTMIYGGESCPTPAMIHQWCSEDNKTAFYNIYGITEVSCWASLYKIPDKDIHLSVNQSVPIGDPLKGTVLQVMDEQGNPVSHGCGTLCIGGTERVCYLDKEEISTVSEPIMRNTGDLVEFTNRGLVYLGRHDDQVKRHGKRITLSQIQQTVEMMSSVSSCATILNGQQLLLFCVPANKIFSPIPQCIAVTDPFFSDLKHVLPSHGLPDSAFWINNLPLTLHGKLDRCGLLQIARDLKTIGSDVIDGRDVQEKLHQLWQQVILPHGTTIDNSTNFLQLGGDSFQAVHMASSIEMWCRTPLPEFVDKLLHGGFQDVVLYVKDVLSGKTTVLEEGPGSRQLEDNGNTLKRPLVEDSQETNKNMKYDDHGIPKVMPSTKILQMCNRCSSCNMVLDRDTEVCYKQKCLKSVTKLSGADNLQSSHNAPLTVQSDQCSDNNDQPTISHDALLPCTCNPDIDFVSTLASNLPCTCWQYSIRRGSQVTLSNREPKWDTCIGKWDATIVKPAKFVALVERWKYNTGKCVDASPLIVRWRTGSVVYIGSHSHKFAAVSMATGIALWESTLGDRVESSACLSTCGKFVVVGCYDNHVYFLNSNSGSVHWKFGTEGPVKSSPVADCESLLVYVGSHDQYLYALDAENKTCRWQVHCGGGSVFSSPCIDYQSKTVYIGTLSGDLLAVCKKIGELRWRYRCPKPIFSSPVASATGVVVGCANGILYSVSHNGDKLWTYQTEAPIFSSPCIISGDLPFMSTQSLDSQENAKHVVFGSHDHCLYCLNQITGKLRWQTKLPSQVYSTPFIFQSERVSKFVNMSYTTDASKDEPIRKCVRLSAEMDPPIGDSVRYDDDNSAISTSSEQDSSGAESQKKYQQNEQCTDSDATIPVRIESEKKRCLSDLRGGLTYPSFVTTSCTSGVVVILDGSSGNLLASYKLPGEVFSSPIVHEDQIIVGCRDDFVYCLEIHNQFESM